MPAATQSEPPSGATAASVRHRVPFYETDAMGIVHHANYKINKLKEKHLQNEGIVLPMPWLLSEFGNVSAASNMIAFLRELPNMKPLDHILIDGFGAGTYYDALAVELGG